MKKQQKKIIAIGKTLGLNLKLDKSLDKYPKTMPEKMEEAAKLMANSDLSF